MNSRHGMFVLAGLLAALAGCNTRHEIVVSQPKPLEVNVNLTGRVELVVSDARDTLSDITGQAPRRSVSLEDIGLEAPATRPKGPQSSLDPAGEPLRLSMMAAAESPREAALKKSMAGRYPEIRRLHRAKKLGESHTGLIVARADLSAEESALVAAENKDRAELYQLAAQRQGVPVAEVALGFYVARLEYAEKGDWIEKFNKQKKEWEWVHWGE